MKFRLNKLITLLLLVSFLTFIWEAEKQLVVRVEKRVTEWTSFSLLKQGVANTTYTGPYSQDVFSILQSFDKWGFAKDSINQTSIQEREEESQQTGGSTGIALNQTNQN